MVSLKRPIIFSLLLLIVIPAQNAIALTYLPTEDIHYYGKQYFGTPGDWIRIEFAVYDNGGQKLKEYFGDDFLPWATDPCDFVYAYQVIHDSASNDTVDFFSISGIGEDAIDSMDDIDSVDDTYGGQEPKDKYPALDFSSAYWEFFDADNPSLLVNGEHSYFLLIKSTHDYKGGTYNLQGPHDDDIVVPNPEPCTLALLGLGSALLLKRQRKK